MVYFRILSVQRNYRIKIYQKEMKNEWKSHYSVRDTFSLTLFVLKFF